MPFAKCRLYPSIFDLVFSSECYIFKGSQPGLLRREIQTESRNFDAASHTHAILAQDPLKNLRDEICIIDTSNLLMIVIAASAHITFSPHSPGKMH